MWARIRLLLEADMTYRARRPALGGARLLFADMHPTLRRQDGVPHIDKMAGSHRVASSGRGLLLLLGEPLPTAEMARRFRVTPSVSQHLRVLYAAGLLTRTRDGRWGLHRHSRPGDRLAGVNRC